MPFDRTACKYVIPGLTLFVSGILSISVAHAREEHWELCHHERTQDTNATQTQGNESDEIVLNADEGHALAKDIMALSGNVRMDRRNQHLQADAAVYHESSRLLEARGNVKLVQDDISILGDTATLNLEQHSGAVDNTTFLLQSRHARGTAVHATIIDRDHTSLEKVSYTTCDPGDEDWTLKSRHVELDHSQGTGTATHVVLSFQHIPFFYVPYMSFPIDDRRKSGFLTPSFRNSSSSGDEFTLPYYLNLAPQADATITPRYISRRGTQIQGEFRYLGRRSAGILDTEHLANDSLYGENRDRFRLRHNSSPLPALRTNLELDRVSDVQYFDDLGNSLSTTSITHLKQEFSAQYDASAWSSTVRLQTYQTIDETIPENARPYRRLPQVLFSTRFPQDSNRLNYSLNSEFVDFQRRGRISGDRFDIEGTASLPMTKLWAYLTPSLTYRYTAYRLDNTVPVTNDTPSRALPSATVDGGLFFERDTRWGQTKILQTLEPRLYYVKIPYREQTEIPLFDSGVPDFSFAQLFRANRFTGADRVGDANQLTLALTTRYIEQESGRQRISASVGQIIYFSDREVTLVGSPQTASTSDTVAEVSALITPSLTGKTDVRWNPDLAKIDKGSIQISYAPGKRRIMNISYRFREAELEQTDLSFIWPLSRSWHVVGRRNYSIFDGRPLETLAGFEYESCCWRFQLVKRNYVNDVSGASNDTLYFQLELKGLTSFGDRIESVLENGILGYEQ